MAEQNQNQPEPMTPEQVAAIVAENAALKTKQQKYEAEQEVATLRAEFPQIKDLSVIVGANLEEKRTHAKKLIAMFPAPAPTPAPDPTPTLTPVPQPQAQPGDAFKGIPPLGPQGGDEAQKIAQKMEKRKELVAAVEKGDASKAFDISVQMQPQAVRHLYNPT